MLELLTSPEAWTALVTLATLEIILGIDNLVMIAILVSGLPKENQKMTRSLGIAFALITRVMLLFTMSWLASLTSPLFHIMAHPFSVRDLVMFFGGVFLLYKGGKELIEMTHDSEGAGNAKVKNHIVLVIAQIGMFDIIFSLDSVITAVGMSNQMPIMVTAIVIAMAVMLFAAGPVVNIIDKHIEIKVLALAFLVIIGVMLTVSGFGMHIPKGYIYSAMGFSALVVVLIMVIHEKREKNCCK